MRYNDEPQSCEKAARALLTRSKELLEKSRTSQRGIYDDIWDNLGFHAATAMFHDLGVKAPVGPDAQCYITLVLAAAEHIQAQEKLEGVLAEIGDAS
ncbi:hypothetical protein LCGC14_1214930 [marine sediment metagenome]|uniref:Uncharacterized protein n=1 Tax=marine sediment metagenome TaxID=412755 RepID=A0A0F9PHM6_9ZZZZ